LIYCNCFIKKGATVTIPKDRSYKHSSRLGAGLEVKLCINWRCDLSLGAGDSPGRKADLRLLVSDVDGGHVADDLIDVTADSDVIHHDGTDNAARINDNSGTGRAAIVQQDAVVGGDMLVAIGQQRNVDRSDHPSQGSS